MLSAAGSVGPGREGGVRQAATLGRWLLWLIIFLLPGLSLACAADEPPPVRDTVEHALSTFVRAFEDLDWKTFRECFSDRPSMFHPAAPNIRRVDSPEDFDKAWRGVFEGIRKESGRTSPPYMKLEPSDLRIEPLSDDVTLVSFHLVQEKSVGRRTLIFKRSPDGWKIVHIHASNIATP